MYRLQKWRLRAYHHHHPPTLYNKEPKNGLYGIYIIYMTDDLVIDIVLINDKDSLRIFIFYFDGLPLANIKS